MVRTALLKREVVLELSPHCFITVPALFPSLPAPGVGGSAVHSVIVPQTSNNSKVSDHRYFKHSV